MNIQCRGLIKSLALYGLLLLSFAFVVPYAASGAANPRITLDIQNGDVRQVIVYQRNLNNVSLSLRIAIFIGTLELVGKVLDVRFCKICRMENG